VTRTEIAEKADLDIRTAAAYAEELCRAGLACAVKVPSTSKGRPGNAYKPDYEKVKSIGLALTINGVDAVLCDIRGNILRRGGFSVNLESESKQTVIQKILSIITAYTAAAGEDKIAGIGVALSRWLRPPLSVYDIFEDLAVIINKHVDIPVFCGLPISVDTYAVRRDYPSYENILVVHPGNVLEFGVQIEGDIPADNRRMEYEFSHYPVDPEGEKCYCGKIGCLENYVTASAVVERFRKHSGQAKTFSFSDFVDRVAAGDVVATKIARQMGTFLWQGVAESAIRLKMRVVTVFTDCDYVSELIMKLYSSGDYPFECVAFDNKRIVTAVAAAEMASFKTVINYCPQIFCRSSPIKSTV